MICRICHRQLTSAESIRTGFGPVCAAREKKAPYLFSEEEIRPVVAEVIVKRAPDGSLRFTPGLTIL